MGKLDCTTFRVGDQFTLKDLAVIWGYNGYEGLRKGVVTSPEAPNTIVLFVTKEKQFGAVPYTDSIDGNVLYMMGQSKHGTDNRLISNLPIQKDEINLFFREKHHTPFVYYGKCRLINAEIKSDNPSEFELLLLDQMNELESEESIIDSIALSSVLPEAEAEKLAEGFRKISTHIRYERNPKNRKEAIRIQGHKCKICGFDYDLIYGNELAEEYIEIHHIKQLSEGEQTVDPSRDLIPVCANCHRMLHRHKKDNISVEEMKKLINVVKLKTMIEEI